MGVNTKNIEKLKIKKKFHERWFLHKNVLNTIRMGVYRNEYEKENLNVRIIFYGRSFLHKNYSELTHNFILRT